MDDMTKHVPDLERCKRLKELGIEFLDAILMYVQSIRGERVLRVSKKYFSDPIPAPLVSEMLEVMPEETYAKKMDRGYLVWVADSCDREWQSPFIHDDSLPNALADLLIWLKENNPP